MSANPPLHAIETAFVTGGSGFVGRNLIRALVDRGVSTRALARSDQAAEIVQNLGAVPIRGDLLDRKALAEGMRGADTVFHCAAFVEDWDKSGLAERLNVDGTAAVLEEAERASVAALVHVSTEAVLIGGPTPDMADETWPYPDKPLGIYPRTKGAAERLVIDRTAPIPRAVIVRPRFIWGNDDSTLLPRLVEANDQGLLRWFDGGTHLTSTCHVDNCVEGMLLAAERGGDGEIYFLTDGPPVVFRHFISDLLRAVGTKPPTKTAPSWMIRSVATLLELLWVLPLPGRPPLTRSAVALMGHVTVSDAKARRELGYPGSTSIAAGVTDLRTRHAR